MYEANSPYCVWLCHGDKLLEIWMHRDTYYFDPMSWSGGQGPGTGLLTGVFIWPVGAGDGPAHAVHNVITTGCRRYQEHMTSSTNSLIT